MNPPYWILIVMTLNGSNPTPHAEIAAAGIPTLEACMEQAERGRELHAAEGMVVVCDLVTEKHTLTTLQGKWR